ncbi:hypothetical protein B7463_g1355, partial [Scytalidium lignicola]
MTTYLRGIDVLRKLPYFEVNEAALDTSKDIAYTAIRAGISVSKDLVSGKDTEIGTWLVADQHAFSTYLGQAIGAWGNLTDLAFKLIAGIPETNDYPPDEESLVVSITSAFYAYTVLIIWATVNYNVFVIDNRTPCGTVNPIKTNGELYYLAMAITSQFPATCSNTEFCANLAFTTPPGLSALTGGDAWGDVTAQAIIQGDSYEPGVNDMALVIQQSVAF